MELLPYDLRLALRANDVCRRAAVVTGRAEPDPMPVLKLFNPAGGAAQGSGHAQHGWNGGGGAGTWLASELAHDGDTLFGLADLGFGCPELGSFSLGEISRIRLPFGLRIERDLHFDTPHPLSLWADTARSCGSIIAAEQRLASRSSHPLPPDPDPHGPASRG
jgi:hypothetical protein